MCPECGLIDIIVTISIAVDTGWNFPRGEVGTKSHRKNIKAIMETENRHPVNRN